MVAELDWLYLRARPQAGLRRLITHVCFQGRQPTMRWLWLNFAYDKLLRAIATRYPAVDGVRKPIFILGVGRSGTTVLGKLLSFHRSVGFLNEPKAMWHVIHPEEDVLGTYPAERRRYRLGVDDADLPTRARAHRLYAAYLRFVRAQRVVDKYPEALYRIPFLLTLFNDAKLVVVLRSGTDTVCSIAEYARSHTRERSGRREDWWGVNDQKWHLLVEQIAAQHPALSAHKQELHALSAHEDRAAVEWALAVHESQRWLRTLDGETIQLVIYEELVSDPRRVLQTLMAFCELEHDVELVRYAYRVLRKRERRRGNPHLTPWVEHVFKQASLAFEDIQSQIKA